MAYVSDDELTKLVEEAFAAGQEHMRSRAASHALLLIGIETGGEQMQLSKRVGDHLAGIPIRTMDEAKAAREGEAQ